MPTFSTISKPLMRYFWFNASSALEIVGQRLVSVGAIFIVSWAGDNRLHAVLLYASLTYIIVINSRWIQRDQSMFLVNGTRCQNVLVNGTRWHPFKNWKMSYCRYICILKRRLFTPLQTQSICITFLKCLAQHRRRWADVVQILYKWFLFAGLWTNYYICT